MATKQKKKVTEFSQQLDKWDIGKEYDIYGLKVKVIKKLKTGSADVEVTFPNRETEILSVSPKMHRFVSGSDEGGEPIFVPIEVKTPAHGIYLSLMNSYERGYIRGKKEGNEDMKALANEHQAILWNAADKKTQEMFIPSKEVRQLAEGLKKESTHKHFQEESKKLEEVEKRTKKDESSAPPATPAAASSSSSSTVVPFEESDVIHLPSDESYPSLEGLDKSFEEERKEERRLMKYGKAMLDVISETGQLQAESIDDMKKQLTLQLQSLNGAIVLSDNAKVENEIELADRMQKGTHAMKVDILAQEPLTLIGTVLELAEDGKISEAQKIQMVDDAEKIGKIDYGKLMQDADQEFNEWKLAKNMDIMMGVISQSEVRRKKLEIQNDHFQKAVEKVRDNIREATKQVLSKKITKTFKPKVMSNRAKLTRLQRLKV